MCCCRPAPPAHSEGLVSEGLVSEGGVGEGGGVAFEAPRADPISAVTHYNLPTRTRGGDHTRSIGPFTQKRHTSSNKAQDACACMYTRAFVYWHRFISEHNHTHTTEHNHKLKHSRYTKQVNTKSH